MRSSRLAVVAMSCAFATACGSNGGDSELVGEATARIAVAPAGVQCIHLGVENGSFRSDMSKDVTAGAATIFQFHKLAIGASTFSGEAFDVACASVTSTTEPSFVADSVVAAVDRGAPASVVLHFRASGSATVTGDFDDDAGPVDTGTIDTGVIDTGAIDTGVIDMGAIDTGVDTGAVDAAPTYVNNVMFITSGARYPDLGVAGFDAYCNERATAAGLPGNYVAWLSTSSTSAISRLAGSRGWVRVDGAPFADRPEDIAAGRVMSMPQIDETGARTSWAVTNTGTAADGTATTLNCSNWTSRSGSATQGNPMQTFANWTASSLTYGCGSALAVYCFGVGKTAPLAVAPPPSSAPRAFVSNAKWSPSGGVAAADALCQSEATAAGASGTYVAYLYTSTSLAKSRLGDVSRTWYRFDGVSLGSLSTGGMFAQPLNVTSTGVYLADRVWLGATYENLPGTINTCNDWSSSSHSFDGVLSQPTSGPSYFDTSTGSKISCDTAPQRLFCFQR